MQIEGFTGPATPKELAARLKNRTARWVRRECREKRIETLPIGRPYLIPEYEANRILGIEK